MSATRDKNQKVAFVYSNLYRIYRNGKEAACAAQAAAATASVSVSPSPNVLKAGELNQNQFSRVNVRSFTPPEFIGKRIAAAPARLATVPSAAPVANQNSAIESSAIESLKENLKSLNDLHARLRFMLQELEDLVKA